jgi:acetate kinase
MSQILAVNSGSSSLKLAFYRDNHKQFSAKIERIGSEDGEIEIHDAKRLALFEQKRKFSNHQEAFEGFLNWFLQQKEWSQLDAIGHRIVHGGLHLTEPCWVDEKVMSELKVLKPIAPEHIPNELQGIIALQKAFPTIKQAVCFDTTFHRSMPFVAHQLPLPQRYPELIRYGFHGLSYESILHQLRQKGKIHSRIIIAHLGNGASMAAVLDGKCVETTMGFTPTGGLMMGTRTGDLDPGVMLYLLEEKKMLPGELNILLNKNSGLKGVSELTGDVKELLHLKKSHTAAKEALELFCRQAKKFIGALIAVLGGIDQLIFTGGIGENAAEIRKRICEDLDFIGIDIETNLNQKNENTISKGKVSVNVMNTDEEAMIANHVQNLLK